MGLFFEVWEVNDISKCEEHDELCKEWILDYVHTFLGKSALPHKLYSHEDNPQVKALSVEYPTREVMDSMMGTLFSDEKFMDYYKKWEDFVDEPPKRYFFDELFPEMMKEHFLKAKQST